MLIRYMFVLAALAPISAASATLNDGLVSYHPFDSNLVDSTGNGNDGSYVGNTMASFVAGQFGQAVQLDGGSEHIQVNNESSYDFGAAQSGYSISTWFKVDAFDTTWQALIVKGEGGAMRLHRHSNTNVVAFNSGPGGDTPGSGPNVNDGNWHHVAAISTPGRNRLYVDGSLIHDLSRTFVSDNNNPLMIGENPDAGGREFEGLFDDVAIWNRALSENEISTIYNGGAGTSIADAIANKLGDGGLTGKIGVDAAGFTVRDIASTGTIDSLADAQALIGGSGIESETTDVGVKFIDYLNGGGAGNFGLNNPFPNGGGDDFATYVTAMLEVGETGDYTFGTNIDDGALLQIDGMDVINADRLGPTANFFGTVNLSKGIHELEYVFFERGGGAGAELFVAEGTHSAFNSQFQLLTVSTINNVVPEPTTGLLVLLGSAAALVRRRR